MQAITKFDRFRDLLNFQEHFNRLFDDTFRSRVGESALTAWAPPVDIYETENELILKADLPDINEKDLDIRLENNTLTIQGERKFEKQVSEEDYLRVERAYGCFTRSFALPSVVDPEQIHAEYHNGVLTVKMPKREESKPKQIKLTVTGNGK